VNLQRSALHEKLTAWRNDDSGHSVATGALIALTIVPPHAPGPQVREKLYRTSSGREWSRRPRVGVHSIQCSRCVRSLTRR
jgi:hypothetical protein